MDISAQARAHAALGEVHRLRMAAALRLSDLTPVDLARLTRLPSNHLAHHLKVMEEAGIITRRPSEGDHRRRYVQLLPLGHDLLGPETSLMSKSILFVCTHNSARSQFASAYFALRAGRRAASAGTNPAPVVHPRAVETAREFGVDLTAARPRGYESVDDVPDLVISVCDRAAEQDLPFPNSRLHWSVPDPVLAGRPAAFRDAFATISQRIDRLASEGSL